MKGEFMPNEIPPSGKLKFSMCDLPDDWHERIFKKDKLVDSSNGKTSVSKTEVAGSTPAQPAKEVSIT